jgi:hypothetical protein
MKTRISSSYRFSKIPLPAVQFALDVNIPESAFDAARIKLETNIKDAVSAVEIRRVPLDWRGKSY